MLDHYWPLKKQTLLICQPWTFFFHFEVFSWLVPCTLECHEICFGEKRLKQSSKCAIISSKGIINQTGLSRMIQCKTDINQPRGIHIVIFSSIYTCFCFVSSIVLNSNFTAEQDMLFFKGMW